MQDKTRKTKGAGACANTKRRIWRGRAGFRLDRRRKPECVAVRVGGKIRVIGQLAAANWLGMSRTTFVAAVEGRKDIAAETVALVKREYPQLFAK